MDYIVEAKNLVLHKIIRPISSHFPAAITYIFHCPVTVVGATVNETGKIANQCIQSPLPLLHIFFGLLALGYVRYGNQSRGFIFISDGVSGQADPFFHAVFCNDFEFVSARQHLSLLTIVTPFFYHVPVIRVHNIPEVHTAEFLFRITGNFLSRAIRINPVVALMHHDGKRAGFGQHAEFLFAVH